MIISRTTTLALRLAAALVVEDAAGPKAATGAGVAAAALVLPRADRRGPLAVVCATASVVLGASVAVDALAAAAAVGAAGAAGAGWDR